MKLIKGKWRSFKGVDGPIRYGSLQLGPDQLNVETQLTIGEMVEVRLTIWSLDLCFTIWDPRAL